MFRATAILPARFDPDAFTRAMVSEMEKHNQDVLRDFHATVSTWNGRPRFRADVTVAQDMIQGFVRTVRIFGEKPPELIYYFINFGTRVRYAKMTADFEPKSRRRVIGSAPGRGGFDKLERFPMHGIEAREFDVAIATKHRARLTFRLRVALRRGVKNCGHAL